jgi:prophage antirepressor-like protein
VDTLGGQQSVATINESGLYSLIDGEPWFVGKDVAEALGYGNAAQAIRTHCKKSADFSAIFEGAEIQHLADMHPQTKLIPEGDVYRLIVKSGKPEAERMRLGHALSYPAPARYLSRYPLSLSQSRTMSVTSDDTER